MAATTTAAATAIRYLPPPASPFASLLRRSRFASYDPAIGQTYSAPSAHASRGNWGLKRPLAVRKRGAFITLKSFEDHAQYIEWNNAETEVRFLRRVEEMNTHAAIAHDSLWGQALGEAKVDWVIDSDFCPAAKEKPESISSLNVNNDIDGLGMRGKGQYGARRTFTQTKKTYVQPNIHAMLPRQFERYLAKIRSLRPEFKAHLDAHLPPKHGPGSGSSSSDAPKSLYELAQQRGTRYHATFLADHTASEFSSPPPTQEHQQQKPRIAPQPHRTGALLYARPSAVDSYFSTPLQPGLALNTIAHANLNLRGRYARGVPSADPLAIQPRLSHADRFEDLIVSFGGLAAGLKRDSSNMDMKPLFEPMSVDGVNPAMIGSATRMMRLPASDGLVLVEPPKVVGRWWGGVKDVKLHATVEMERPEGAHVRVNAFYPGTMEYVRASSAAPRLITYQQHSGAAPTLKRTHVAGLNKVGEGKKAGKAETLKLLGQFVVGGSSAFGARMREKKVGDGEDDDQL